jgi:hypothetical protein
MRSPFPSESRTEELDAALAREYPKQESRILVLLEWYGAGEGQWSGFPSYESVPEKLLLRYDTKDILRAIEKKELAEQQIEGTARFFAGWDFSQTRRQDLKLLPAKLKKKLLEHSLKSKNEDKKGRAQTAFGDD